MGDVDGAATARENEIAEWWASAAPVDGGGEEDAPLPLDMAGAAAAPVDGGGEDDAPLPLDMAGAVLTAGETPEDEDACLSAIVVFMTVVPHVVAGRRDQRGLLGPDPPEYLPVDGGGEDDAPLPLDMAEAAAAPVYGDLEDGGDGLPPLEPVYSRQRLQRQRQRR